MIKRRLAVARLECRGIFAYTLGARSSVSTVGKVVLAPWFILMSSLCFVASFFFGPEYQ